MKKIKLFMCFIAIASTIAAQNVGIGTISPASKLHVKGADDVSQLIIDANSTQSNTNPLIKLRNSSGADLMWIHSDHVTNSFVGLNAGRVNNAGGGGIFNAFIGSSAEYSNSTGYNNTSIGTSAGFSNTTASENTAIGNRALFTQSFSNMNTPWVSGNVAIGYDALYSNQPTSSNNGINNTAVGHSALRTNTTGYSNTANGYQALFSNIDGAGNTANGSFALFNNTFGRGNTAIGHSALYDNITGYYNIAIGYNSGNLYPNLNNTIGIGNDGYLPSQSNQVIIGNNSTTFIGGKVNWGLASDARIKHLIIFNRFGQKVFEKKDVPVNDRSQGWNGDTGNQPPTGTAAYVYVMEVVCKDGQEFSYKGTVMLIR